MNNDTAGADAAYCATEVRRYDYDRYLCAMFAHGETRADLLGLLAFNVELARTRESVSEPMLGEIRLQWWRETIDGVLDGTPRQHAVARALHRAHRRRPLARTGLLALIDVRSRDLDDAPLATLDALYAYAVATGGLLLRTAAPLLGEAGAALDRAESVGTAWALIGLVRALPFHAAIGRVLMPADLIAAEGLTLSDVKRGDSPSLRRIVGTVATRARATLSTAAPAAREESLARPTRLAVVLCQAYLRRLDRVGNNPFSPALRLSPLGRQVRLLAAIARGLA